MRIVLVALLCLGLAGCADLLPIESKMDIVRTWTDEQICKSISGTTPTGKRLLREELIRRHSEWSERAKSNVLNGKISIGMTRKQVLASWGTPDDINKTVSRWGVHEQWVYDWTYIYIEDGVVTSYQN